MAAANRGRRIAAITASAIAHAVVLAAVALHAPTLFIPHEARGPPEPVIPVLLTPRLPPPAHAPGARPGPIRLHRRHLRFAPHELPIPPLPVPERPAEPQTEKSAAARPAPLPSGGQKEELRATLRHSAIGCANPEAAGLTREEREACADQLGRGAATAAATGLGLSREKAAALDAQAAHKEACRAYRDAPGAGEPPPLRGGPC